MQTTFEHVRLAAADPPFEQLAQLTWRLAEPAGRAVQVYVDGELYDAAADAEPSELWLHLDRSVDHRIALMAVEPAERWVDHVQAPPPQPSLVLGRDESLPIDSVGTVRIGGVVVYEERLWSAADHRGGFGALFGVGEFARDAPTGPGLGLGEFAVGPFGADGRAWRWRGAPLPPGPHTIDAQVHDAAGRTVAQLPAPIQHDAPPPLPAPPALTAEPGPTGLTLRWA